MKKFLLIVICLFFLVGCTNNSQNSNDKSKITSEIEYFSSNIVQLLHGLNNISTNNYELISEKVQLSKENGGSGKSQSEGEGQDGNSQTSDGGQEENSKSGQQDEGSSSVTVTDMQANNILKIDTEDINWDSLKAQIELVNTSWSVVMLDLYNANISNHDIIAFGDLLNRTIISMKNEDKAMSLNNLTSLYSYIPKFLNSVSADKHKQNIETTKYHILKAYSSVTQDDWNTTTTELTEAENSFLSIINDTEFSKNNEFKINKTYMLIKDLQNSIPNNDKQLFYLKYRNLIDNLDTL